MNFQFCQGRKIEGEIRNQKFHTWHVIQDPPEDGYRKNSTGVFPNNGGAARRSVQCSAVFSAAQCVQCPPPKFHFSEYFHCSPRRVQYNSATVTHRVLKAKPPQNVVAPNTTRPLMYIPLPDRLCIVVKKMLVLLVCLCFTGLVFTYNLILCSLSKSCTR